MANIATVPSAFGTAFGIPFGAEYVTAVGVPKQGGLKGADSYIALTADGAITPPTVNTTYVITKGTAAALTIADPASTTLDGVRLTVISSTAAAHTLSNAAGSGFNAGGAATDIGTYGGAKGDNIVFEAYQGKWLVVSKVNVTLA